MQQLFLYIFSAPTSWGTRTAAGGFAPDGAAAFSAPAERGTRTASAGSHLTGGFFSAPAEQGTRTAQACSPLTGGEFFAEVQRGSCALRSAGDCRARGWGNAVPTAVATPYPRRWAKRKGHLRFPFLFELLPFPCLIARRKSESGDRFEKGNDRGFFLPCLSKPVRRVR